MAISSVHSLVISIEIGIETVNENVTAFWNLATVFGVDPFQCDVGCCCECIPILNENEYDLSILEYIKNQRRKSGFFALVGESEVSKMAFRLALRRES